jgi:hypothetical protein
VRHRVPEGPAVIQHSPHAPKFAGRHWYPHSFSRIKSDKWYPYPKLSEIKWEAEEMLLLEALKKAQAEYGDASPAHVKEARRCYLDALGKFKDHVMMPEQRSSSR